MKKTIVALLGAALLALAGAAAYLRAGLYDVAATTPHTAFVHWLLETTMRHSVAARAAALTVPPLREPARLALGAACYRAHCAQCHGGPGIAPGEIGKSLQPLPGTLIDAARRWRPQEVYWITRHGIKMSGMPAWELRLSDDELWAVTAFVDRLAELSPADYQRAVAQADDRTCGAAAATIGCDGNAGCASSSPSADARPLQARSRDEHARLVLNQYACTTCHVIPGVVGPSTQVGPPLDDLARREAMAGGMAMTGANLERWIRDPQGLDPTTAMPNMGVGAAHARLMADYLLRPR